MRDEIKILVIGDERDSVELLKYNLSHSGFYVMEASEGFEAIEKLCNYPDIILLDMMLPRLDGFEVCRKVRNMDEYNSIPIIFLASKASEKDEIFGLNLGANDFIYKPISINKISARISSCHRTNIQHFKQQKDNRDIILGPLVLSKERYLVLLGKDQIELARKEFEVLYFLASNPGKVFKRGTILNNVWGEDVNVIERTVDVHLLNIRRKFGNYSRLIETVRGVGYRIKDFS